MLTGPAKNNHWWLDSGHLSDEFLGATEQPVSKAQRKLFYSQELTPGKDLDKVNNYISELFFRALLRVARRPQTILNPVTGGQVI